MQIEVVGVISSTTTFGDTKVGDPIKVTFTYDSSNAAKDFWGGQYSYLALYGGTPYHGIEECGYPGISWMEAVSSINGVPTPGSFGAGSNWNCDYLAFTNTSPSSEYGNEDVVSGYAGATTYRYGATGYEYAETIDRFTVADYSDWLTSVSLSQSARLSGTSLRADGWTYRAYERYDCAGSEPCRIYERWMGSASYEITGISIHPLEVPEPSAGALVVLSLATLLVVRRRTRTTSPLLPYTR